jgi:hypothetical protein
MAISHKLPAVLEKRLIGDLLLRILIKTVILVACTVGSGWAKSLDYDLNETRSRGSQRSFPLEPIS